MQLKGKPLTLTAKILAVLIVIAALALKSLGWMQTITMAEVIQAAGFVVVVFAPIDVSLWFDTIFNKRALPEITTSGGQ